MNDELVFTIDTVESAFEVDDAVTTDSDDNTVSFNWDEVEIVSIQNHPWERVFDTDEFLKISAVVARPIRQRYIRDGERVTFKKPADELRESAAWLDNRPFTLGHPSTKTVKTRDQIHGFWRGPEYDNATDELIAYVYIPYNDEEAKDFISRNNDVSVGFYNKLVASDEDNIDAYQTEIYYDHVAAVKTGRCSEAEGCGLELNNSSADAISTNSTSDVETCTEGACSCGIHNSTETSNESVETDDEYKTVGGVSYRGTRNGELDESEIPSDEFEQHYIIDGDTKTDSSYPVVDVDGYLRRGNVDSAWDLRGHAEGMSTSELEDVIRKLYSEFSDVPDKIQNDSIMTNENDDNDDVSLDDIDINEFGVDELADAHEGVEQLENEVDELQDELEDAQDEASEQQERLEAVKEQKEELASELDEYKQEEKQEVVDDILELTSTWDEDDLLDTEVETLEGRLEALQDAATTDTTVNTNGGNDDETDRPRRRLDLSDNA